MTEESATEFLLKVCHLICAFQFFTQPVFQCGISQVAGWNLVNENGTLKLNRSWKVKSFTKGLELFQLVGNVAETEGMYQLLVAFTVSDI